MRFVSLFFLLLFSQNSHGSVLYVGRNYPDKTIKQAVSKARDNDTVFVEGGIYKEGNIIISKGIKLIGLNKPVLDGQGRFEIMTVSANNFLIKGLVFKNSGYSSMNDFASIKVIDASDFTISDNTVLNASFAIHVSNSTHFTIRNNTLAATPREEQNTGNGIHLWKCNQAEIIGNRISGHRDGIYFEFVTESKILDNFSSENMRYGLHFMFSNNDTYTRNTFRNNGAGVAVMFSHHVTMMGNYFEKNLGASSYGILLKEISDGSIFNNTFTGNTVGIYMEGTGRLVVKRNRFEKNGWAFRIQASCNEISVMENNFIGNTFDVATNGTLVLNTFDNNYWDKYEGYDLNKDGKGDVPFHPLSMFAMVTEEIPSSIMLFRSFMVFLLERVERAIPSLTPLEFRDNKPLMKALVL